MKINNQKGFILPLVIGIIAILLIGGGAYVYTNKKVEAPVVVNTNSSSTSTADNVNDDTSIPIITSITPATGPVGTAVEITGKYLNGFEGETVISLTKENGENALMSVNSYVPKGATTLKFTIPNKTCKTISGAQTGLSCPSYMIFTPGVYKIFAQPWSEKSNEVKFTVVATSTTDVTKDWKTYTSPKFKFEMKYLLSWNIDRHDLGGYVRFVNSQTPGKIDTGEPREIIEITPSNEVCTSSDWIVGYGLVYYKTACMKNNPTIHIEMIALDDESQKIEDQMLSTFKFTN